MTTPAYDSRLTPWQRFRRKSREVRPLYLLQIVFQKVVPRDLLRVRSLFLFETDFQGRKTTAPDDPNIRWATMEDVAGLARLANGPEEVRARFESGARAVIALRDGRVVAAVWYRPGYCEMDHWMRFTAPADAVWGLSARVLPEYRGQRLFGNMKRLAALDYARAGHSRILTYIETLNYNSIKANRTSGGRPVGRVVTVRFLGFSAVYCNRRLRVGRWTPEKLLELPIESITAGQQ